MAIWIDLLIGFSPWIFLLGEVYLGKRVYDATRRRSLLRQKMAQLRLLASSLRQSPQRTHASSSASQGASRSPPENLALLLMFREQLPAMPSVAWDRLATATVVGSVFVLACLGMSVLLRPFAYRELLDVLPLCLPLAAIPLPYLFSMKPRATLLLLVAALGLTFLTLALMGV
jgi:hypothetical protein